MNHPKVGRAMSTSYVWDYARNNISKLLAWKILLGQAEYRDGDSALPHHRHKSFLKPMTTDAWEEVDVADMKTKLFGSYVVWDKTAKNFVRSGKAINIYQRLRQHNKDKDSKDSTFYLFWRTKWSRLSWHVSLGLDDTQTAAANSALWMSKDVAKQLRKAKWDGAKLTFEQREPRMMAYLSELVDDLLMDHTKTFTSEAPGFEGPLGVHCRDK